MVELRPDIKVAILQTGRAIESALAEHGDYDEMCKTLFKKAPDEIDTFRVLDNHFPDDIDAYDLYIITGSKHGVYEPHKWILPLENLIREAFHRNKKLIGICFGHQIMAQALGGCVEKSDKGLGVGLMDYDVTSADGTVRPVSLYAWHQDQVVKAPDGSKVIAKSDFCPIAGLQYGDQAISVQAHPEFTADYERDLLLARRGITVSKGVADKALRSLDRPNSAVYIQSLFIEFANA
ncbi:type 1 glutamine amidotransferase [Kordiimonas aquimaris]|uniref:type 1 glutamine amidotransferase n=1 Tax=Kordiimonas aquimaris TaxID=707591 RepID=UPI0021D08FED|nr:type 1 glutamine amidotransferase [Kordiimonas aquimaris]